MALVWLAVAQRSFAQVVISEIHHTPDVKTEAVEFVELHNAGMNPVNLGGWSFTDGFNYTFPATNLPPGGYVVVAQNPAALFAKFGVGALGPFNTNGLSQLSGDGEKLTLRDALGNVVDEVTYGLGFPWPTVGDPPGYSIELIHPALDNDLGGHWRVSIAGGSVQAQETTLIEANSTWSYLKGTQEASSPVHAWRLAGFNVSAWPVDVAPVGYGSGGDPIRTRLDDMRGNYTTVYFRRTFVLNDPAAVTGLLLEAVYDDGFKVWINGTNVLNVNISAGEVPHTGTASSARESSAYELFTVSHPASFLKAGENVIAVQACNASLSNSSDFFFDLRLRAQTGPSGRGPTPGRINAVFATNAPPTVRQVVPTPDQPRSGQPVVLSAKVTDQEGVASVVLHYQVVHPGAYIEFNDAAYTNAANWIEVPMNDAGLNGDPVAGDGTYACTLPASVQVHRRLVRYRITVTDVLGAAVRVPYADDPEPNFAYFVYDGVPDWSGALRPGVTEPLRFSSGVMGRLPAYHLIAKNSSVVQSTWTSRYGGDAYPWWGTLVYDGKVYDHIRYRARGGVWRYSMAKNMWKFDFNRGHDFAPRDNWGSKFKTRWRKLNLGASIQQGDYNHRGEQGMFESVGFRLFQLMGVPAPNTSFVTFRVIDDALEADPGTQYEGDFWGVYLAIEQEDGRFLDEHGLPDGNFYKMEGGSGELNNLGPMGPTDKSDLNQFLSQQNSATDAWWRTNFNLRSYYGYQAVVQAIHHYDIADGKNYFYYRDPHTRIWEVIPWDLDLTWADNMYRSGQAGGDEPFKSRVLGNFAFPGPRPVISTEFRNRVREFRDLLWNTDEAYRLIDDYARLLRGPAGGFTILDADRAMWDYNPKMISSTYTDNPGRKAGHGRFYQWPNEPTVSKDFNGGLQALKNYVVYRATNAPLASGLRGLDGIAEDASRPLRPTISSVGPAGFPVNRLEFRASEFATTNPTNVFAAIRWRAAEITSTNAPAYDSTQPPRYEIEADWEWTNTAYQLTVTLPPGAAKPGHRYRVRALMTDDAGRNSHWSLPVEFNVGEPDNFAALTNHLRITEVMFNPLQGEFEFVELHNTSPTLALELNGAKFTQGIDFTFPAGSVIAPGGYLVLSKATDLAAFRTFHGIDPAVPVLGPFGGSLADGGEQVVLRTAAGGTDIVSFSYGDGRGWPAAADGGGHSLVLADAAVAAQPGGTADYAGNWGASSFRRGSPGRAEAPADDSLVLNEVVAHTDFLTEFDSNDWIELYNRSEADLTLGAGWYLSDSVAEPTKWMIPPGTVVPARGWVSFDEVTGFHNPTNVGFGLDKAGEQVVLAFLPGTAEDRIVDVVTFKGQENDWSLGRYPDGGAWWQALAPRTRGTSNTAPAARVYFSEIMFHPPDVGLSNNTRDEFIEVHNPGFAPVELFNTNGTWRLNGGVDFDFPPATVLPAGGCMLVLSFAPTNTIELARFKDMYQLTASGVLFAGPYSGKLANNSDRIALERPQAPDLPGEPMSWVIVDEVLYADQAPWPAGADGTGLSLHRAAGAAAGSDPSRWRASSPTPGSVATSDADADGMPDDWETDHGLDPADSNDAQADPDGDGATNLEEFMAGTDPRLAESVLALVVVESEAGLVLRFQAAPNRGYTIQERVSMGDGSWTRVSDFPAEPDARWIEWTTSVSQTRARFYRVVTPPMP